MFSVDGRLEIIWLLDTKDGKLDNLLLFTVN